MRKVNLLFSLYSLDVLLLTAERFSFTTKVLLQPYNFIRLHEILQGPIFLTISVIIPFFIIREITNNFSSLKNNLQFYLTTIFVAGAFIYGLGEGWHELASFTFNQHCDINNFVGDLCGGLFINDYYTGNILFYLGAIPMNLAVLFLDKLNPSKVFSKNQLIILFINKTKFKDFPFLKTTM